MLCRAASAIVLVSGPNNDADASHHPSVDMAAFRISALNRRNAFVLRAFWLLMILGHAPAIFNVAGAALEGAGSWSKLLLLLGAQLFFLAKFVCPHALCRGFNRRTQLAVLVIILLLHAGVFERVLLDGQALPPAVPLLSIGGGVGAFGKLLRHEATLSDVSHSRTDRRHSQSLWRCAWETLSHADLPPRDFALVCLCTSHRAPPR